MKDTELHGSQIKKGTAIAIDRPLNIAKVLRQINTFILTDHIEKIILNIYMSAR